MTDRKRLWHSPCKRARLLAVGAIALTGCFASLPPHRALAQIVPDATLGRESSVVTPGVDVGGFPAEQIGGGAVREANLFHSFAEFNVGDARRVYFVNPAGIERILARVTGTNRSDILGTLGVLGNADLFLINPKGIVFGENARLDVAGSFVASTADSIGFDNDFAFSASDPQTPPLLTINVPIGLQYGANTDSGQIVNRSRTVNVDNNRVGLQVPPQRTLALVGGDVVMAGGILTATGGRIELGSVAGNSRVGLTPTDTGYALGYEGVENFGDIELSNAAIANVSGEGRGDVRVRGRRVTLTGGSQIAAIPLGAIAGGSLAVTASESVEVVGGSTAGGLLRFDGSRYPSGLFAVAARGGDAGELNINAPSVRVREGGNINTTSFGQGKGGNLTINTGELIVLDGSQIAAGTIGFGEGGHLLVNASELVELSGTRPAPNGEVFPSGLFAQTQTRGDKNAGDITVNTRRLVVRDGAQVTVRTFVNTDGVGSAGTLRVNATESVEVIGNTSEILASSETRGEGGAIAISTDRLTVRDGGRISAATSHRGEGGSITVDATSIETTGGGQILTTTSGSEDAGDIELAIRDRIALTGTDSGIFANTTEGSSGNGGSISTNPRSLDIRDGAGIGVNSEGSGRGGNIQVRADSLTLQRRAFISAETLSTDGGNISIENLDLLLLRDNSLVSTTAGTARAGGNGGNIQIDADFIAAVDEENSDIRANAFEGRGGNINITARGIFGIEFRQDETPLSDITASSQLGVDGVVEIDTPDVDPARGVIELPTDLVDPTGLITASCSRDGGAIARSQNEFYITGRGGLPVNPGAPLDGDRLWQDLQPIPLHSESGSGDDLEMTRRLERSAANSTAIVEAKGWVYGPNGQVILTADVTRDTPHSPEGSAIPC